MILNMDLSGLNKAASLMFTNPEENNETPHFLVNHAGVHHMDASLDYEYTVCGVPHDIGLIEPGSKSGHLKDTE